jgi:diaminopimelate epimerase
LIPFTKAHACGNDFLVIEEANVAGQELAQLATHLCARNTSIGADGVEFFTATGALTGRIRLYNADGSIAELSGNGTRCVAAWLAEREGARPGDIISLETDGGLRESRLTRRDGALFEFQTSMGIPEITEQTVELADGTLVHGASVNTGNPHFVVFVEDESFDYEEIDWESIGSEICLHPDFPDQTNVEFVAVRGADEIAIRIFERGVGPTTSSGTGTTATSAAAIALHGCNREVKVEAPGGMQFVSWPSPTEQLLLTGPAELIAEGEIWQ